KVASTFSGNGSYSDYLNAHMASLNLVQCHRSINYMAEMMETKFGIPWMKVNFIGVKATSKSLRKIAEFFEDPELTEKIEKVIEEEEAKVKEAIAPYRERLEGKTAFLFVGGSRAHHYQDLFSDLGMETVVAGYEFAHRDDYEGREVLEQIQVDADSRNIPEIEVEPDPERYRPRKDPETLKRLKEKGIIDYYEGMIKDMKPGTIIVDDISHFELELLIERLKPDIVCSGIKDKYVIQKMGVPSKQLHNYDYSGPFAGYEGAINFAKEIDMLINNPAWKLIEAPWNKSPLLKAELAAS
ncbi:MAG: nitrogenase molybdenum-iron protein alpha chain, partial [Thermodesulfobacteria bacterium]|nr:nitrogenase molybdenum-iron protein alpha chain [Thermodesulfobacteriota bacterium]